MQEQENLNQENFNEIRSNLNSAKTTDEFSMWFEKIIAHYQISKSQYSFNLLFDFIENENVKMTICEPKGLELLNNIIADNLEEFIKDEAIVSLKQLCYFDFNLLPTETLKIIKQKLLKFVLMKQQNANSDVWDQINNMLSELEDVTEQTVFKKIPKLKLITNLVAIIDKPYIIKQPKDTNLCGPVAILQYIFNEIPSKFTAAVNQFFNEGKTEKPFTMLASNYSKNSHIDIITAISFAMKHASNYYLGYDHIIHGNELLETYCGITEPRQMVDWLQALGCNHFYEDIPISVPFAPFTKYNMPNFIANTLLWRWPCYSSHHKTITTSTDRISVLEDYIKSPNNKKIILLLDMEFCRSIINKYFEDNIFTLSLKDKQGNNITINTPTSNVLKANSTILHISHYVYLESLHYLQETDKFECIFYDEGKLIRAIFDKTEFFNNGLKGLIVINNTPALDDVLALKTATSSPLLHRA